MQDYEFEFPAPVLRQTNGQKPHYIPLPDDVALELRDAGIRRVFVSINNHTFNRAIQGASDGGYCLIVGKATLRDAGVTYGSTAIVSIRPDMNPDHVLVPDELNEAFKHDAVAAERFNNMTPGKRRSLVHYVQSAKRSATRRRRSLELAEKLRTHTLYGDDSPD